MCPLCLHWFMTTDSTNATQEHPTLNVAHSLLMNAKVMMEGFLKVGLDSKDLPAEWSESTIIAYDDSEKLKFKEFCLSQVKRAIQN